MNLSNKDKQPGSEDFMVVVRLLTTSEDFPTAVRLPQVLLAE
jgi:hypothetical protein